MNPETARSSTELIAEALRTEILRGKLKSGQPLRQDKIAARFGVSKLPLREALNQLKAEGLLTFIPNRGAFVSTLTAAEAREIYVMRISLELAALELAIPSLTVAQLRHAQEILDSMDRERDIARWAELNWDFHAALYAPAALPRLMVTIRSLHASIARYLLLYLSGMAFQKVSQQEHRDLLEACRHGETRRALSILKQHMRGASNELVGFLSGKVAVKGKKEKRR